MDRDFNQSLVDNLEIAEVFMKKKDYIQYLLGMADGSNLLNTSNAICHVPRCKKIIKLKAMNNISSLIDHWKRHADSNKGNYHESCELAIRRHRFLTAQHTDAWVHLNLSLEELEGKVDMAGEKLAIQHLTKDCFKAETNTEFKGKYLMLDFKLLERIIEREANPLSLLQDE